MTFLRVCRTEMDVQMAPGCTQQDQARVYSAVLEACLANAPHCDSFMVWEFTDKYSWLCPADGPQPCAKAPNLLDASYKPKPAFTALQSVLSKPPAAAGIKADAPN
jgi:GH35 family endo-1,4-beta-xylanase